MVQSGKLCLTQKRSPGSVRSVMVGLILLKKKNLRIFILKNSSSEYYVGIRRVVINRPISGKYIEDAIEKVRNMKNFEVIYYPILGLPEFVVPAEKFWMS